MGDNSSSWNVVTFAIGFEGLISSGRTGRGRTAGYAGDPRPQTFFC
jgi:hypothetical protein